VPFDARDVEICSPELSNILVSVSEPEPSPGAVVVDSVRVPSAAVVSVVVVHVLVPESHVLTLLEDETSFPWASRR
jgi:hypothetical protein